MKAALVGLLLMVPGTAWAGCSNYVDGSLSAAAPKVTTCFDGKCEATTVDFECANTSHVRVGFANGLTIIEAAGHVIDGQYTKGKQTVTVNGKEADAALLKCKAGDALVDCLPVPD